MASLSVVTPSEEEHAFAEAYWQRVPFGALSTEAERVAGARLLLHAVLRRALPQQQPGAFVQALLAARYLPLYGNAMGLGADREDDIKAGMSCSLPAGWDCDGGEAARRVAMDVGDALEAAADAVGSALSGDVLAHDPAVQHILIGDYVEEIARWAVGACNVGMFLDRCFT